MTLTLFPSGGDRTHKAADSAMDMSADSVGQGNRGSV